MNILKFLNFIHSAYSSLLSTLSSIYRTWNRADLDILDRVCTILTDHPIFISCITILLFLIVASLVHALLRKKYKNDDRLLLKIYLSCCYLGMVMAGTVAGWSTLALHQRINRMHSSLYHIHAPIESTLSRLSTQFQDLPLLISALNQELREGYMEWLDTGAKLASEEYSESTISLQRKLEDFAKPVWAKIERMDDLLGTVIRDLLDYTQQFYNIDDFNKSLKGIFDMEALIDDHLIPQHGRWRKAWHSLRNGVPRVREAMEGARQDPRMMSRLLVGDLMDRIERSRVGFVPRIGFEMEGFKEDVRRGVKGAIEEAKEKLWQARNATLLYDAFMGTVLITGFLLSHKKTHLLLVPLSLVSLLLTWNSWNVSKKISDVASFYGDECRRFEAGTLTSQDHLVSFQGQKVTPRMLQSFVNTCLNKDDLPQALLDSSEGDSTKLFNLFNVDKSNNRIGLDWSKLTTDSIINNSDLAITSSLDLIPGRVDTFSRPISNIFKSYTSAIRVSAGSYKMFRQVLDDLHSDVGECQRGSKQLVNPHLQEYFGHEEDVRSRCHHLRNTYDEKYPSGNRLDHNWPDEYLTKLVVNIDKLHDEQLKSDILGLEKLMQSTCDSQKEVLDELVTNKLKPDKVPRLRDIEERMGSKANEIFKDKLKCKALGENIKANIAAICAQTIPQSNFVQGAFQLHFYSFTALTVCLLLASRVIEYVIRLLWKILWKYILAGWIATWCVRICTWMWKGCKWSSKAILIVLTCGRFGNEGNQSRRCSGTLA